MTRPRRSLVGLCALVLGGCGIQGTGVISSGEPASGLRPLLTLYFVDSDRHLASVSRPGVSGMRESLGLLMKGPTPAEQATGLRTEVTRQSVEVSTRGNELTVQSDTPLPAADDPAAGQIVCTLASASTLNAAQSVDDIVVFLEDAKGRIGPLRCSDYRQSEPIS